MKAYRLNLTEADLQGMDPDVRAEILRLHWATQRREVVDESEAGTWRPLAKEWKLVDNQGQNKKAWAENTAHGYQRAPKIKDL